MGIRRARVVFTGQADHAGTTPMEMRKDAGTALFQFASGLGQRFREISAADTVWNMGHVAFHPGAGNVVPKRAELLIEWRDVSPDVLDRMEREIQSYGEATAHSNHVEFEWDRIMALHPTQMDPGLREVLAQAAAATGTEVLHMPSGAGHDAMMLSRHVPSAMLFIPSIGGRSHDVAEDSREEDIVLGSRVLANAVATLIG